LRTSDTLKNTNGYKNSLTKEYFLLGNEYYKKNEYNLSASFYDSALKHNYECPEVHNNLGVIFALLRREDNAIDCFKNSIKANLNQLFAFINLANIYIKIGNYS
jgi:tetratricopeptide (TPR) repeat protein